MQKEAQKQADIELKKTLTEQLQIKEKELLEANTEREKLLKSFKNTQSRLKRERKNADTSEQ